MQLEARPLSLQASSSEEMSPWSLGSLPELGAGSWVLGAELGILPSLLLLVSAAALVLQPQKGWLYRAATVPAEPWLAKCSIQIRWRINQKEMSNGLVQERNPQLVKCCQKFTIQFHSLSLKSLGDSCKTFCLFLCSRQPAAFCFLRGPWRGLLLAPWLSAASILQLFCLLGSRLLAIRKLCMQRQVSPTQSATMSTFWVSYSVHDWYSG